MPVGELVGSVVQLAFDVATPVAADVGGLPGRRGAIVRLVIFLPAAFVFALMTAVCFSADMPKVAAIVCASISAVFAIGSIFVSYRAVRQLCRPAEPSPPEA